MKKEQINPEDFNFFRDENGIITAEPKKKSLKLEDIIKEQFGKKVYYANGCWHLEDDGFHKEYTYIDQISQKSARKVLLFGYIQRIADYANNGWEPDWNDEKQIKVAGYVNLKDRNNCQYDLNINTGFPVFKSDELFRKAVIDNKEIFDEFFSL